MTRPRSKPKKLNEAWIGLIFLILIFISIYNLLTSFLHPQCPEWLTGTIQLVGFIIGFVLLSRNELLKHTGKFLIAMIISIIAAYVITYLLPYSQTEFDTAKKNISIQWQEQENRMVIDLSDLTESTRNKIAQVTMVTEDHETHITSFLRPILIRGRKKIEHLLSEHERKLFNKSESIQLRFSQNFSVEPAFILHVERPRKFSRTK